MNTFLFLILPYICLAIFVVGHWWRYKYDKFGWTTRSSQLYEDSLLRWGSPLFHFGMLGVVGGHIIGLLLPKGWTDRLGVSESTYHAFALGGGLLAGAMALVGLIMLVYRRRTVRPVFKATTVMDKVMYLFLGTVIVIGCWNTFASAVLHADTEFNYRTTVSPWFRGIFYGQPDPTLMAGVPVGFQMHAVLAFLLFALWPFTRLVHVFSAPVGYLTRPYIVYRSRADHVRRGLGNRSPQPGWERPGLDSAGRR
ncbi:MAG: respiratory nitrate reductase subunit gamma [Tetrasphaera sp.]|nr:respiratory nitrate reductase subunit gamma [Tetrasphaera sp.]